MHRLSRLALPLLQPLLAVLAGLIAGSIAILVAGGSIAETYAEMWKGAFGSFYFFTNTLGRATPIILVAIGAAFAFRAGFFNLGAEGQMIAGALVSALVGLYMPGPAMVVCIAALAAGIAAGGLFSALAGWMDARFRVNLLISTLLLNYIAALFAAYLVSHPLKDRSGSAAMAQTPMLDPGVWLPKLFKGMPVHAGFVLAVAAAVAVYVLLRKTVAGYEIRMLGGNPLFAVFGGVRRGAMMLAAMFLSGGLAGLAGAAEVLGAQYRYIDGSLTTAGFAWTGIMAALLARSHPLGAAVAAFFLAALQAGGMGVERNTEVPLEIGSVIQAVLILFISAKFTWDFVKRRKGSGPMEQLFDLSLFNTAIRVLAPILLAALGGALCARVGLFNVGLEGMMLVGAFTAIVGNHYFGNVVLAVLFAIVCVSLFSLVFGYLSIHLQANVIVVGIALNFLAMGLTTFALRAIFDVKGAYYDKEMAGLPNWDIPLIRDIPVVRDIFSGHSPLVYLAFVIAAGMWYFFYKTIGGFRFLAAGENPLAAGSLGIGVRRYQYGAVIACGVLCALAGAQLSLGQVTMFTEGMTAGRGFIALVATMLGQSGPLGVTAASLLFGLMDAFSIRLQGMALPTQFTQMVPYVVTILAMFFFRDKGFKQDAQKQGSSSR